YALRCLAQPIAHLPRPLTGKRGHGTRASSTTPLPVQDQPRAVLFILPNAIRVLPRMPQTGAVEQARNSAAGVHQHQPDGTTNGSIGAVPRSKEIIAAVDLELLHHRAIHYQQDPCASQTCRWPYQVKGWLQDGLHG